MPILNYTTKVAAEKTASELIALLVTKGARRVTQEYGNGKVIGVGFTLEVGGIPVYFKLPANEEGVLAVLKKNAGRQYRNPVQARRVAWRILKDWVEAQIALIESGQATMDQVFLPYAEQSDGRTLYQTFLEHNQQLALGAGARRYA